MLINNSVGLREINLERRKKTEKKIFPKTISNTAKSENSFNGIVTLFSTLTSIQLYQMVWGFKKLKSMFISIIFSLILKNIY